MDTINDIIQLAKMLETEWNGGSVDRVRMRELAEKLMPHHPEIHHTLASVRTRMSRG